MREVSSTSPTSEARRVVSSPISARNASRWSGCSSRQRPAASGRADHRRHRAAQLVRDERDEVGAQRREPPQLLDGAALALVGADVLHGGCGQTPEQADELDLVLRERVRLASADGDEPDRASAREQRRDDPGAHAEREELRLLRVLGSASMSPRTIVWPRLTTSASTLSVEAEHGAGRHHLVRLRTRGRDHARRRPPRRARSPCGRTGTSPRSSRMNAVEASSRSSDELRARAQRLAASSRSARRPSSSRSSSASSARRSDVLPLEVDAADEPADEAAP